MDTPSLEELFEQKLDLSEWEYLGTKDDYAYDATPIPNLQQKVYQRPLNGEVVSIGVFSYRGRPAYIAWGLKSETHCGFHAPLSAENKILETRPGCPDVKPKKNRVGKVIGFILDDTDTFE